MNRYLYKAKRLDNGEWVIGNLITNVFFRLGQSIPYILCPDKAEYDCFEDFTEENGIFEVQPDTICQCTGLRDKNGKLIWENDIIECKDGKHNFQTQIEWDAYCAGFIFQDTETSAVGLDTITANGLYSESKVIGNIFDNPELLESEENN